MEKPDKALFLHKEQGSLYGMSTAGHFPLMHTQSRRRFTAMHALETAVPTAAPDGASASESLLHSSAWHLGMPGHMTYGRGCNVDVPRVVL